MKTLFNENKVVFLFVVVFFIIFVFGLAYMIKNVIKQHEQEKIIRYCTVFHVTTPANHKGKVTCSDNQSILNRAIKQ